MKRLPLILFFVALAGLFFWLVLNRSVLSSSREAKKTAKTIVPTEKTQDRDNSYQYGETASYDESRAMPLIPLENEESFLQALSIDLNGDSVTDQVCAVKTSSEQNIFLIPGLQNPLTGEYTRLQPIRTGITQARTLLMYAADIIGDRSTCLIFSGMTLDNLQLLAVYLPSVERDGKTSLTAIADLRSDGPITVRETPRSDAYNLGVTNGDSYPIITYNSDPDAPETLDQIERVYHWDKRLKRYEQVSESRITGKRLESKLVSQLHGGSVESFENYLAGLWYMPASTGTKGPRYLFFDTPMKEIIFQGEITEEVFVREAGAPRRYGAFLTTRNRSISSIRRLIDIELTGIDEIRIKILEDVKLKIGVASDWDGIYRKMAATPSSTKDSADSALEKIRRLLISSKEEWNSADGQILGIDERGYSIRRPGGIESGQYALLTVAGDPVLQLRTGQAGATSHFYRIETSEEPKGSAVTQRLSLTEVTVSMSRIIQTGSTPLVFTRAVKASAQAR